MNAWNYIKGDRRYWHLVNSLHLENLIRLLFGEHAKRAKSPAQLEAARNSMQFAPTPRNGPSMKALRKARDLPPFLIKTF